MTGEELLRSCDIFLSDLRSLPEGKIRAPNEGMPCWHYMAAVQNFSVLVDQNTKPLIGICAPPESTLIQFIRIFTAFAKQNPQHLHYGGAAVALRALQSAFPCSK
jgi:hypothetical protein